MHNENNKEIFEFETNIRIFMRFLQEKSGGLFVHSVYTAFISQIIASAMNLTSHDIRKIFIASLLHDLGKVFVPNNILLKDTKLTSHEKELIKLHPTVGANIVEFAEIFDDIPRTILYHHELPDGSGYPEGLRNNDIPLNSKILALADKYAALSEKRIYRDSLSYSDAVTILSDYIESSFDGNKNLVISTIISINDNTYLNLAIRSMSNYENIFFTYFNFKKILSESYSP